MPSKTMPSPTSSITITKPTADTIVGVEFVPPSDESVDGVVINAVWDKGLLAAAHVRPGDVLHTINATPVTSEVVAAAALKSCVGDIDLVVTMGAQQTGLDEDERALDVPASPSGSPVRQSSWILGRLPSARWRSKSDTLLGST